MQYCSQLLEVTDPRLYNKLHVQSNLDNYNDHPAGCGITYGYKLGKMKKKVTKTVV